MISLNDLISPLNGLVAGLLRSPLHGIASKNLMLIDWSGRKSGRSFSIPVGYQREDDALIVLISKREEKTWWKSFRSPWPATLHVRGQRIAAMGEVVLPGRPEFFAACERTLERLPWMGSQLGGVDYDAEQGLDARQRDTLMQNVGVVRFELLE